MEKKPGYKFKIAVLVKAIQEIGNPTMVVGAIDQLFSHDWLGNLASAIHSTGGRSEENKQEWDKVLEEVVNNELYKKNDGQSE